MEMSDKRKVVLRSYPKAIFLYPLALYTIIALLFQFPNELTGFWSTLFNTTESSLYSWLSAIWLIWLFICLFVVSIEVKFSKLLAASFFIVLIIVFLVYIRAVDIFSMISGISEQNLKLPTQFYIAVLGILAFVLGGMRLGAQFEYVDVEANELWCVNGIMGRRKERFPTRSLEINVEKPDFLEAALGTGRINIKIPSLNKYIQLDTVFRANRKVKKINELLGPIEFVDVSPQHQ